MLAQHNDASLPTVSALWIEGKLSYIEHICLKSMMHCGHHVILYQYGTVENIPEGVEVRNAETILPRSKLLKHKKSGSYSLGSNIFRYELLQKEKTIWIDTDVYCLKPLSFLDGIVFGRESDAMINGAVLAIPADHEMLKELKSYYDARVFLPPWWSKRKKFNNILRSFIGIDKKASSVGWGVLGPKAITYFANKVCIADKAQEIDVFYPISIDDIDEVFESEADPMRFVTENSRTLHLWNEVIKHRKKEMPAEGSLLHKLCLDQDVSMEKVRTMLG